METTNKRYYIEIVNYPFGIEGFAEVKPYKSYGNNLKEAQNDFEEYCLFNENVRESAIQLYEYDEELDMEELKFILENEGIDDLAEMLGQSEQSILNTINKAEREAKEGVDQLYKQEVTCPKCGHKFQKKDMVV